MKKVATDNSPRSGKKVLTAACIQLKLTGLTHEYKSGNWFVTHPPTQRTWAALDDASNPHGITFECLQNEPEQPQKTQDSPDAVVAQEAVKTPKKRRKRQ